MNTKLLNTILLDDGRIIKKGSGGGGGVTIKNQSKSVDIVENGTTEIVADSGYTGLGKVSVNVNVASSGGTTIVPAKAVNFRDYDGTVLYAYTKDEFLALNELPPLPTQPGLICQEWNWDYADALEYVRECGILEVGATYITDDGKTRLYISINNTHSNIPLYFSHNVSNGVIIDWGDGSDKEVATEKGSVVLSHRYASIGNYVITIEVAEGDICTLGAYIPYTYVSCFGNQSTRGVLGKVELGYRCGITGGAFYACKKLSEVILNNSITSIENYAFRDCYSLVAIVLPKGIQFIDNTCYKDCYNLNYISLPNSITMFSEKAFENCINLRRVVIPKSVTEINQQLFNYCRMLSSVVIPNNVTVIGEGAFNYCSSLKSLILHNGITSLSANLCYNCSSLSEVKIPSSVTSIGEQAFYGCSSVAFFDFRTHTSVPTLSGSYAFYNIASDCKIVVPDELYDSWIAATNWSAQASKIVKASEFNG